MIVILEQDGVTGYGEAYEDLHTGVTVERMAQSLLKREAELSGYALSDPYAFYCKFCLGPRGLMQENVFASTALEMAACDLWGKLCNVPLWRAWKHDMSGVLPVSSYTLGLDSLYRIIEKFHDQPGWPIYRVKLGSHEDMTILRELRKLTNKPFRIDVNGNWTLQQALEYLDELCDLNIESIEQPLHPDDWDGMRCLYEKCDIPLIADESCRSFEDIDRCVGCFHGINLKPHKFGGLNRTRLALSRARARGFYTMMGSSLLTTVAASAISQFVPLLDYVYIDGPQLLDKVEGLGVTVDHGHITMSPVNGVGFFIPPDSRSEQRESSSAENLEKNDLANLVEMQKDDA